MRKRQLFFQEKKLAWTRFFLKFKIDDFRQMLEVRYFSEKFFFLEKDYFFLNVRVKYYQKTLKQFS